MFDDLDKQWEIIKIKAELLCWGIQPNEVAKEISQKQNPCHEWKTGNVGLHLLLAGKSAVLVTVDHTFDKKSPYLLDYLDEKLVLLKNGEIVTQVEAILMPAWYEKKTKKERQMSALFLHEGRTFLHQAYSGCDYHSAGLPCKFCSAGSRWWIAEPEEVGDIVNEAFKGNNAYHVCLGGGTRLPHRKNVTYFSACIREIRKKCVTIPIWVEMPPPDCYNDISDMIQLGATSFGFNIEIWDDTVRSNVCPGKSQIPKNQYLEAMKTVTKVLGPNRIGSCLLVGLEPIKSSIEGALMLASIGVQPCILPFKPWNKCLYKDHSLCDVDTLIEVSKIAVEGMIKNNISPEKNQGCLLCEGCTIDHDIHAIMKN
jgi:hypothetical protein